MSIILTSINVGSVRADMTQQEAKAAIFETILKESHRGFWRALTQRIDWAYRESFQSVQNDTRTLINQKRAKLLDERFYLVERALDDAANQGGATSSGQKVELNGWNYTVIRAGGICIVQNYVRTETGFARPGRLREKHAAINGFLRAPQLPLGDIPAQLFAPSSLAGIIIHGPKGRNFTEDDQRLGFLSFGVPRPDYSEWAVNVSVEEIVTCFDAHAESAAQAQRDIAVPTRKARKKRGTTDGEA